MVFKQLHQLHMRSRSHPEIAHFCSTTRVCYISSFVCAPCMDLPPPPPTSSTPPPPRPIPQCTPPSPGPEHPLLLLYPDIHIPSSTQTQTCTSSTLPSRHVHPLYSTSSSQTDRFHEAQVFTCLLKQTEQLPKTLFILDSLDQ